VFTYDLIESTTVANSSINTVTFSSIPGTYTDLQVLIKTTGSSNLNGAVFQINGNTSNNYSQTFFGGSSSTVSNTRSTNNSGINWSASSLNQPLFTIIDIFNYANPSVNKSGLIKYDVSGDTAGGATTRTGLSCFLYRNTSAITSLYFFGAEWGTNSTFSLYGIKAA
jgi:hypothetical protein